MNLEEFDTLIQRAIASAEAGDKKKAQEICEKLSLCAQKIPGAHHRIGWVYASFLGQYKEALQALEHALIADEHNASLHNHLGSVYKKVQNPEKALYHYLKALEIEDNYADAHHNIALLYVELKNIPNALAHFQKAIHANPSNVTMHYNLGLLFLKLKEVAAATTQFNNVIQLNPNHIEAHAYLGVLYLEANQLENAETAFQNVLKLNPEHVETLSNLGVIALKRDEGQKSVAYFTQALAIDNENIYARNNLAATFMHHDRFENALIHYEVLLKEHPLDVEYLYNAGVAEMALGHHEKAISYFETLLSQDENHAPTLANLAAIYMKTENKDKALAYFEKVLRINPEDSSSLHMVHALKGDSLNAKTCFEYAHDLFNNYASFYDNHMQDTLKYALPQAIMQLLDEHGMQSFDTVLDLGCGTGLTGVPMRNHTKKLVGVDIAPKMIKQAQLKGIYDDLVVSEAQQFLEQNKAHYDAIIAADVLPYFSSLETLFELIREHLTKHGIFVFSIEISDASHWELQETVRFAHHPNYIQELCTRFGFTCLDVKKTHARSQNEKPVPVLLYLLEVLIIS